MDRLADAKIAPIDLVGARRNHPICRQLYEAARKNGIRRSGHRDIAAIVARRSFTTRAPRRLTPHNQSRGAPTLFFAHAHLCKTARSDRRTSRGAKPENTVTSMRRA